MSAATWGERPYLSARAGLLLAAGLLLPALLLANGYESTLARVHDQGNKFKRVGRTYNENGDEDERGLWWDDDGKRQ